MLIIIFQYVLYPRFTLFIRFWPGHLSLLDGHYGYKASMDEYNGVCFSCFDILLEIHLINRHYLNFTCVLGTKLLRVPSTKGALVKMR